MAIKDQCYCCTLFSGSVCERMMAPPEYNQTSCEFYKKRGINLNKIEDNIKHDSIIQSDQQSSNIENETNVSHRNMFSQPFSSNGRIRRLEYCLTYIAYFVYNLLIEIIMEPDEPSLGACVFVILSIIPCQWILYAQGAKRCHDLGHSGWYQLIPFYVIWMFFVDGEPGANQYGSNPKS